MHCGSLKIEILLLLFMEKLNSLNFGMKLIPKLLV